VKRAMKAAGVADIGISPGPHTIAITV
jgi:hypothetical protein